MRLVLGAAIDTPSAGPSERAWTVSASGDRAEIRWFEVRDRVTGTRAEKAAGRRIRIHVESTDDCRLGIVE